MNVAEGGIDVEDRSAKQAAAEAAGGAAADGRSPESEPKTERVS